MKHRPRYITIDSFAQIHEVTNLYDRFGNDTNDPKLAASCVVHLGEHAWKAEDTDDIPIYTVH